MSGVIRIRDKVNLPGILDNLRVMLRMRQCDLAASSGYRQSQISEWTRGVKSLDVTSLIGMAHALGYDLALIPRQDDQSGRADPLCVWPDGVDTCGEPEGHQGREDA